MFNKVRQKIQKVRQKIQPLVLEPETPFAETANISGLVRGRKAVWFIIIFCGTILVLNKSLLEYAPIPYGRTPHDIIYASILCIIHVSYLFLVAWVLVFSKPPELLSRQRIQLVVLLLLAYMAGAAGPVIPNLLRIYFKIGGYDDRLQWIENISEIASYSLFFFLYLIWLLRDWCEKNRSHFPPEKTRLTIWMVIEFALCVTLGLAIFYSPKLEWSNHPVIQWLWDKTTIKDVALFLCLAFWLAWQTFESLKVREGYVNVYKSYLMRNVGIKWVGGETKEEDAREWASSTKCFFDFGSGDGSRLKQLMDFIWPTGIPKNLKVYGHDDNATWKKYFDETFSGVCYAEFFKDIDHIKEEIFAETNLVHLSHMLYEPKVVEAVISLLKKFNLDTRVVIRGCSPRSFFAASSIAYSTRIFTPTYSHLWNSYHLPRVIKNANLQSVREPPTEKSLECTPDLLVQQSLELKGDGVDAASNVLRYLYKEIAAESANRLFSEIFALDNNAEIANDDLVYLMIKKS